MRYDKPFLSLGDQIALLEKPEEAEPAPQAQSLPPRGAALAARPHAVGLHQLLRGLCLSVLPAANDQSEQSISEPSTGPLPEVPDGRSGGHGLPRRLAHGATFSNLAPFFPQSVGI